MSETSASQPDSMSGGDLVRNLSDLLSQLKPFWTGITTADPPTLIKTANFDQQWAVVLDEKGSYRDESGRRIAVRKRLDDGSLSTTNDVDWAAYCTAKFWSLTAIGAGASGVGERPSIVWRQLMRTMRRTCKEEIRALAIRELDRFKIRPDTKTTIFCIPPDAYPYPSLLPDPSAIRLVVLWPALEAHADIVCRLCNSALSRSDIDRYEALSYVWGDASKRKSITVEGRVFQATQNLEAALRNLRYRDKPRVLWIDAICINQNDVMERNAQVQQMDLIYKRSQRVVVWLGPESEDSGEAMRFMRDLPMLDLTIMDTQYRARYMDLLASSLAAVDQLLGRPWFTRIWCIQEFVLGPHAVFQCGQEETPWEKFMTLQNLLLNLFSDTNMLATIHHQYPDRINDGLLYRMLPLAGLGNWKRGRHPYKSVLALLSGFRGWQSSDPRDYIFALYGLVPDGDPDKEILRPNYQSSVSALYTSVAIHFFQQYRDLTILSIATQPVRDWVIQSSWLPCWVPDWRQSQHFGVDHSYIPIAYNGKGSYIASLDANFDACLRLKATPVSLEDDEQVLCLSGIKVDTIEAIGDTYLGWRQLRQRACQIFSQWKEIAKLSAEARYPYTGQPVWEAFCRTLMFDSKNTTIPGQTISRGRLPPQGFEPGWFREFPPSEEEDANFLAKMTRDPGVITGRRFFRTTQGLFGLGQATAKEGDQVAVLFGGRAPFIVRDCGWHHLIGECYVHGIMDGETIHQPRTKAFQHLQEEIFRLG